MSKNIDETPLDDIIEDRKRREKRGREYEKEKSDKNHGQGHRRDDYRSSRYKRIDKKYDSYDKKTKSHNKESRKYTENKEEEPSVLALNIPASVKVEEMNTLFSQYGSIKKINIYWIPERLKSCNVKVFYTNKENCEEAVKSLNEAELDGRTLKVIFNN